MVRDNEGFKTARDGRLSSLEVPGGRPLTAHPAASTVLQRFHAAILPCCVVLLIRYFYNRQGYLEDGLRGSKVVGKFMLTSIKRGWQS